MCKDNKKNTTTQGLENLPVLRLLKEPAMSLNDLYVRYPNGGEFGWFAWIQNYKTLAFWDVDTEKWELMSTGGGSGGGGGITHHAQLQGKNAETNFQHITQRQKTGLDLLIQGGGGGGSASIVTNDTLAGNGTVINRLRVANPIRNLGNNPNFDTAINLGYYVYGESGDDDIISELPDVYSGIMIVSRTRDKIGEVGVLRNVVYQERHENGKVFRRDGQVVGGRITTEWKEVDGGFVNLGTLESEEEIRGKISGNFKYVIAGTVRTTFLFAFQHNNSLSTQIKIEQGTGSKFRNGELVQVTSSVFEWVWDNWQAFGSGGGVIEESGTWTPILISGGDIGINMTTSTGRWTRIGRRVFIDGGVLLESSNWSGLTELAFAGLPFAPKQLDGDWVGFGVPMVFAPVYGAINTDGVRVNNTTFRFLNPTISDIHNAFVFSVSCSFDIDELVVNSNNFAEILIKEKEAVDINEKPIILNNHRAVFQNSLTGRAIVEGLDIPQDLKNSIFSRWGDVPTIEDVPAIVGKF